MAEPVPQDYDNIKVRFYELKAGDFIEIKPGVLEKIAKTGRARNSASFALTENGTYRENGYGIKAQNPTAT